MAYIASPWRVRGVAKQLKVPPFSRSQIRGIAKDIYIKLNQTLATFQISSMSSYISDTVMGEMKAKFGKTVLPGGSKPHWEAKNLSVSILNYAVIQVPDPLNLHFVQATVRITGNQKFVVHDRSGKAILGKDEFKPIEDVWVLEKILEKPENPWIVVATHLDHPDDVASGKTKAAIGKN
jgi:hypothetical protein